MKYDIIELLNLLAYNDTFTSVTVMFRTEAVLYSCADKSLALPDWKKQLKGRHFSSDAEVIGDADTWLDGQPSELFFEWLAKVTVWSL